jgi:hypothetical protein
MNSEQGPKPFIAPGNESPYRILTGKVKHEVREVNPQFAHVFSLKPGDADTQFGYFACDTETKQCTPAFEVGISPGHNRSFTWSEGMEFIATDGTHFSHINLKGIGDIRATENPDDAVNQISRRGTREGLNFNGLMSYEDALHDMKTAEKFAAWGIRVTRGIAILTLKEIHLAYEGTIPVDELGKRFKNLEDVQSIDPVIYVRAFRNGARVNEFGWGTTEDIDESTLHAEQGRTLEKAIRMVRRERGLPDNPDVPLGVNEKLDYLEWFAKTLGENIGRMHAHGMYHQWIFNGLKSPQNITLACEITDLDDVKRLPVSDTERAEQLRNADEEAGAHILELLVSMNFNDKTFAISPFSPAMSMLKRTYRTAYKTQSASAAESASIDA